MKKTVVIFSLLICTFSSAQNSINADSTFYKHEFSASFAPVFLYTLGSYATSSNVNFNFSYKRYFKNRMVLRTAFVIFPRPLGTNYYNNPQYNRTVGDTNVFVTFGRNGGVKTQLNLGLEKIFRARRCEHGRGADVFFNHMNYNENEYYFKQDVVPYPYRNPKPVLPQGIDSLGYTRRGYRLGGGAQLFYSLRCKMTKHIYLSATVGPSINISRFSGIYYNRKTKTERNESLTMIDFPNVPLVSDLSLCYRF